MSDQDYVLPIRSSSTDDDDELTAYLSDLSAHINVIVVDASPLPVFEARARRWNMVTHVRPIPRFQFLNGKVNGVLSGLDHAGADKVIIADEDVRYDADGLVAMAALLDRYDVVLPQNYFQPAPWHARWDTARSLLNRVAPSGDYPGTLGVRRSPWLVDDGYDGDVLFENLELIRTVVAHGGTKHVARGLYVRRLPPSTAHFAGQRLRQAYDSQAQPLRLAAELAVLPLVVAGLRRRRLGGLTVLAATSMAVAECGRRRAGGVRRFPASASLLTPMWLLERGMCSWLAIGTRIVRGGVRYSGGRISRAAHSTRQLRRQAARRA